MQRYVRVRPAPGKPKVSHPGQGLLMPGTQSSPRFIGYTRLGLVEARAEAKKLGVLPRELPEDVLFQATGEAEIHPLRLVQKAIERGELLVEATVPAANVAFAKVAMEAAEAKAADSRKPSRKAPKGDD